jgi:hypothetical protein
VIREFAQQVCTHLVLTADRHDASPADAARIAREASAMAGGVPCVVGVAVVQMEAWLLVAVHAQGAMDPRGAGTGAGGG